jgi:exonuclease SbcD
MIGNIHNDQVERHVLPIYDTNSQLCAYVVAVPYAAQRMIASDFYRRLNEYATLQGDTDHVPVIFLGHLAASSCESTGHALDNFGKDAMYIGNIEAMEVSEIGLGYDYVALGHIHKAQNLNERARYSGSPIAMSFDEVASDYRHSISIVEIEARGAMPNIREVEIATCLPLVNIPAAEAATWDRVLQELTNFPSDIPARIRLNVLLQGDDVLPYDHEWKVNEALLGKSARHCETNVQRVQTELASNHKSHEMVRMELAELLHMQPIDVARKWMERQGQEMTPEMEQLFNYAMLQAIENQRYED